METLLQSTSLVKRAFWLIRLRWVAILILAAATTYAGNFLKVSLPKVELYVLAGILVCYNFVLFDLMRYFTWKGRIPTAKAISRMIMFQITVDFFILTVILHFSGGIENPFFLYFVFHTILASVLLSRTQSYVQATLAVIMFGLLVLLEYRGLIGHYQLSGFVRHSHYNEGLFVLGTWFVLSTTLYLVVYMTTSISQQLRIQQEGFKQANIQLKEKDVVKSEYVMRLTHDIRGHLAAIESCLDIVINQMVGPLNEKQMDLVERAYRRASKCMIFITSLLKLTRMKLISQLDMSFFSLKNVVFNAIAAVERRTTKKAIKVSYEFESGVDQIYGEPVLIEEMLTNLLFNAARYTPEGGRINILAREEGENVLIQVIDTGIGIPEGEQEKIFEEFYRAENARKVERDGTGLGLAIAKQVVERHKGRIWAEDNKGGPGSTFNIILPKARNA
jgi:signal transduction histidine kinase